MGLHQPLDRRIGHEAGLCRGLAGIALARVAGGRGLAARGADLEAQLQAASDARFRVVVTDGVFSMDGYIAPLAARRTA